MHVSEQHQLFGMSGLRGHGLTLQPGVQIIHSGSTVRRTVPAERRARSSHRRAPATRVLSTLCYWRWPGQMPRMLSAAAGLVGCATQAASAAYVVQGTSSRHERTPLQAPSGLAHTSQIPSDVSQVRPLLLQDHANAVTDRGMPVTAAPRVLAF